MDGVGEWQYLFVRLAEDVVLALSWHGFRFGWARGAWKGDEGRRIGKTLKAELRGNFCRRGRNPLQYFRRLRGEPRYLNTRLWNGEQAFTLPLFSKGRGASNNIYSPIVQ